MAAVSEEPRVVGGHRSARQCSAPGRDDAGPVPHLQFEYAAAAVDWWVGSCPLRIVGAVH